MTAVTRLALFGTYSLPLMRSRCYYAAAARIWSWPPDRYLTWGAPMALEYHQWTYAPITQVFLSAPVSAPLSRNIGLASQIRLLLSECFSCACFFRCNLCYLRAIPRVSESERIWLKSHHGLIYVPLTALHCLSRNASPNVIPLHGSVLGFLPCRRLLFNVSP